MVLFCIANSSKFRLFFPLLEYTPQTDETVSTYEIVSGKPDELFFNPESKGALNHLQPIDDVIMEELRCKCKEPAEPNAHASGILRFQSRDFLLEILFPISRWSGKIKLD